MKDEREIKAEEKRQQQEAQQIAQGDSEAPIHSAIHAIRAAPEERHVRQFVADGWKAAREEPAGAVA